MFFACFTFIFLTYFLTCAEVVIDFDGGYKNVLVAINPEISDTKVKQILLDLERTFKEASEILQTATRGQVFFKEIIFLIPKKYSLNLPNQKWIKYSQESKHPDIFITNSDLFDNPYTIQHAGCGKQGLRIHIPSKFLTSTRSSKAKALVREWAHYRYGIFDENGYPGDELFPSCYKIPGSDTVHVTSCTNEKATYDFRKNSEEKENLSATCNPIPVRGGNDRIQSSLMDKMEFPKVTHFCDDEAYPHNRDTPSKHNAFCKEQSTWKVISQHDDFRSKRKGKFNNVVSFKYVIESEPRFMLAVDSSKNMTLYDRLDLLKNAFSYFVLYSMPENSTAGLINLRNTNNRPLLINLQNQADAERLIDAFPENNGEDSVCVHCGIFEGLQALEQYGELVIATATDISEETYKNVTEILAIKKLPIHILFFKKRLKEPPLLQKLSIHSGGKFFYIVEDFSSEYPVSSLTLLYEAFRSIYQGFSWMNQNHILVDKMTFYNGNSPRYSVSFISDKSMKNFQVLLTGPRFHIGPPVIKDKILLSYGNESYAPGHPSFAYKSKIAAYMFSIEDPQPGTWTLLFERKPGYDNPLVVMIRSSARHYNEIINIYPWVAVEDATKSNKPKHPPVVMYADVRRGNQPIINVKVTAYISQPSTDKEILLELYDGGEGDPDITKNDGIFSRYFRNTLLDTGYYFFTFVVESWNTSMRHQTASQAMKNSHCCGSSIPVNLAYDSGSFKRVASYGSFYLNKEKLETYFPPRRINDLRVDSIQISENSVICYVLKWTAPGDNYDIGTADKYDLRVFRNRDDIYSGFDTHYVLYIDMWSVHGSMFIPAVAGTIQSAVVELKNLSSGIYYLAMRTIASKGAKGDISNIVEIMYTKPDIMDPSINPTGIEPITGDPNGITESNESGRYMLSDNTRLAIGLSCGILFILLITGLILYFYLARYRKHKKEPQTTLSQNTQKTESNDTLCRSTGNGNISIISPVNSWAADSLLTHYETLKKDKNSGFNGKAVAPSADASDSTSIASSKYSYNEKLNPPAPFYDSVYFNQYEDRDDVNYPYNPRFVPFNPTYTSSLRRPPTVNMHQQYSPNNVNFYDSATLDGRRTYQLRTDV